MNFRSADATAGLLALGLADRSLDQRHLRCRQVDEAATDAPASTCIVKPDTAMVHHAQGQVYALPTLEHQLAQAVFPAYVIAREGGVRTFSHPTAGQLAFEQLTLQLQGRPDLKLTVLLAIAA